MKSLVFVYGTLKTDCTNHFMMEGCEYLDEAKLFGFSLYNLGVFPGIIRSRGTVPISCVFGELYDVPFQKLKDLDRFEGVPHLYTREMVRVQRGQYLMQDCWTYIYAGSVARKKHIYDGIWRTPNQK